MRNRPIIDPIADALINRRIIEQHPRLQPVLSRPTTTCVYDGRPSVEVLTGPLGQRYGHCADCARATRELTATWPSLPPHTWAFTNRATGRPVTVTCLPGCTTDHDRDTVTPTFPGDITCSTQSNEDAVTLPVDAEGDPIDARVLNAFLEVRPFSDTVAETLPYAVIELVDQHYVDRLDPDALATVINVLAERVAELRRVHAELVRSRAVYAASAGQDMEASS
ncbi:DUF6907 domain-containing protein [Streptomyces sediminimaris]|uniref:DUF6907 domain-containing protein n=1 Tax=Streptomyces sediminimaris TaxID=3383721 RepID=UPI00399A5F90